MDEFDNLDGQMIRKGQPDPSDAYVVPELTNMSVGFMQDEASFVHWQAFPSVPVELQKGKYPVYPRGYFWRDDMKKRADGAPAAESGFAIDYADLECDVWAWKGKITPQLRANAKNHNLDQLIAQISANKVLINREVQWMANHFVTGKWTTEVELDDDSTDPEIDLSWVDADALPIDQIDRAKLTMKRLVGGRYKPNLAIFGAEAWNAFKNHANVKSYHSGGQTDAQRGGRITLAHAAGLLEVDRVLVADAIRTTSPDKNDKGATDTFDFIGSDDAVWLGYVAPSPGLMIPSAGYTFEWSGYTGAVNGVRMSRWFDPNIKSDYAEVEQAYDQRVVVADMGIFIHNVLDSD